VTLSFAVPFMEHVQVMRQ